MKKYSKQPAPFTTEEIARIEKQIEFAISKKSPCTVEQLRDIAEKAVLRDRKKISNSNDAKWEQRAKVEAISNDPNHTFDWFGHGTQAAYQRACLGSKFN